ncbi:methyltransferase domain-containing protein [Phyllosticta citrichinensis]|uniref:Methyltransferase domain-containing protein n=1 Tax=Phyllosticta citrichinensis TaxID=1130410 RepID=A0ABR1XYA4_9PEZI
MEPTHPLPLPPHFASPPSSPSGPSPTDAYISSLLRFGTTSTMLRTLCGGMHILDFFTRTPDLYSQVLPASWRAWFRGQDIARVLDFLMRDDVSGFDDGRAQADVYDADEDDIGKDEDPQRYADPSAPPPPSLVRFVKDVRMHLLDREWREPPGAPTHRLPRPLALGMKVKKLHEVEHFAAFVDRLAKDISSTPVDAGGQGAEPDGEGKRSNEITHVADFGSGQNYLGRALACPPYSRNIIAIESREHNIAGARGIDVLAKLAPKKVVWRNKKEWKKVKDDAKARGEKVKWNRREEMRNDLNVDGREEACEECGTNGEKEEVNGANGDANADEASPLEMTEKAAEDLPEEFRNVGLEDLAADEVKSTQTKAFSPNNSYTKKKTTLEVSSTGRGTIQYVTHRLEDGNLSNVIGQILDPSKVDQQPTAEIKEAASSTDTPLLTSSPSVTPTTTARDPGLMVISLHSCGNLLHHGLRSLTLNPSVRAVAMIGCCYNLLTERLGPPSYKLPQLRPNHPRLEATANAHDPHGFPMSARYAAYRIPGTSGDTGVRLNITARMMAVQAPQNWGPRDSDAFFTRHFYRALLQRVMLERGIVEAPKVRAGTTDNAASGEKDAAGYYVVGGRQVGGPVSPAGTGDESGDPLVIGTLPKSCYRSFVAYVRGAVSKILSAPSVSPYTTTSDTPSSSSTSEDERKRLIAERMTAPALSDADIAAYEAAYAERRKELSVVWSLMAFSAGVVEAMIVVDRYCWLREQEGVKRAWVQTAFEYGLSPRNLVVVGVKG